MTPDLIKNFGDDKCCNQTSEMKKIDATQLLTIYTWCLRVEIPSDQKISNNVCNIAYPTTVQLVSRDGWQKIGEREREEREWRKTKKPKKNYWRICHKSPFEGWSFHLSIQITFSVKIGIRILGSRRFFRIPKQIKDYQIVPRLVSESGNMRPGAILIETICLRLTKTWAYMTG